MSDRSTIEFWSKIISEQSGDCGSGFKSVDTDGDGEDDSCEPLETGEREGESVQDSGFRDLNMDEIVEVVDQAGAKIFQVIKSFSEYVSETKNYDTFTMLSNMMESASQSSEITDDSLKGKIESLINFKNFWNRNIKSKKGVPDQASNLAEEVISLTSEIQNSEYGVNNSLEDSIDSMALSEDFNMKLTREIIRREILSIMEAVDGPPGMNPPDQATFRQQRADRMVAGRTPLTDQEIDSLGSGDPGSLGPINYENWSDMTGARFIFGGTPREVVSLASNELSDVIEGRRVIKRGQRGKDVELVQTLIAMFFSHQSLEDGNLASELMGNSGPAGNGIDGIFGSGTESVVELVQEIARDSGFNYVQVDGQVGRQTLGILISGAQGQNFMSTFDDPTPLRRAPESPGDTGPALVDAVADEDETVAAARDFTEMRHTDSGGQQWIRRAHSDGRVTYHEEVDGQIDDVANPDLVRTNRGSGTKLTDPDLSWN